LLKGLWAAAETLIYGGDCGIRASWDSIVARRNPRRNSDFSASSNAFHSWQPWPARVRVVNTFHWPRWVPFWHPLVDQSCFFGRRCHPETHQNQAPGLVLPSLRPYFL